LKVAPVERGTVQPDTVASSDTKPRAVVRFFLVAALLVLLWEIVALARRLNRLRARSTVVTT
jgi:hypothetical protein